MPSLLDLLQYTTHKSDERAYSVTDKGDTYKCQVGSFRRMKYLAYTGKGILLAEDSEGCVYLTTKIAICKGKLSSQFKYDHVQNFRWFLSASPYFFLIEVKSTEVELTIFKMYNSVAFSTFMMLYNHCL